MIHHRNFTSKNGFPGDAYKIKSQIFNDKFILYCTTDPFNDDVIHRKALKSVSFVLNEFSQIGNIESKLTTYWHKRGEQLRND